MTTGETRTAINSRKLFKINGPKLGEKYRVANEEEGRHSRHTPKITMTGIPPNFSFYQYRRGVKNVLSTIGEKNCR